MDFKDKNGLLLQIGDIARSDDGIDCKIISISHSDAINETVMYGQQVNDSDAFCILTKDNLALQFSKLNLE